jgi:uncharacterized protein YqjF (DUF2071 family)
LHSSLAGRVQGVAAVPTQNDFDYSLLETTAHRPWPLPGSPWIMTQTWHDLLFAHWPVPIARLRPLVPPPLPVDTYEGQAWLGIIPFGMTNVAPRGVPALPVLSAFEELNVRTYVTLDGKPGIFFFSLDASNPLAVRAARWFFHLPYHSASMMRETRDVWIRFRSRRTGSGPTAELDCQYRPTGPPEAPRSGTLEHFLTERYCLYTLDRRGRPCRLEIHHNPWPLQSADAAFDVNSMAEANGLALPLTPPLLHYAKRQDMIAWALTRI